MSLKSNISHEKCLINGLAAKAILGSGACLQEIEIYSFLLG
jgi:hypothetical protein